MAPGWEMGMGSSAAGSGPMHDTSAQTYLYQRIDDLLDFSNNDDLLYPSSSSAGVDSHLLPPPEPSAPFSMNEISSSLNHHFSFSNNDQLYIPYCEEEAELEWLSRFVDDSFSDIPYHHVPPVSSPAPPSQSSPSTTSSSSSSSDLAMAEQKAGNAEKSSSSGSSNGRGLGGGKKGAAGEVGVRRCTHCASEKTPQWRTGPMGPKTLCNACGVRYKSGRLVPEYRPAASPTFVLTQHSNSHRKVLELRRQKELMLASAAAAAGARPEFLLP